MLLPCNACTLDERCGTAAWWRRCFLSLPDVAAAGSFNSSHVFRICCDAQPDTGARAEPVHLFGFVHFRQQKDLASPRGYLQARDARAQTRDIQLAIDQNWGAPSEGAWCAGLTRAAGARFAVWLSGCLVSLSGERGARDKDAARHAIPRCREAHRVSVSTARQRWRQHRLPLGRQAIRAGRKRAPSPRRSRGRGAISKSAARSRAAPRSRGDGARRSQYFSQWRAIPSPTAAAAKESAPAGPEPAAPPESGDDMGLALLSSASAEIRTWPAPVGADATSRPELCVLGRAFRVFVPAPSVTYAGRLTRPGSVVAYFEDERDATLGNGAESPPLVTPRPSPPTPRPRGTLLVRVGNRAHREPCAHREAIAKTWNQLLQLEFQRNSNSQPHERAPALPRRNSAWRSRARCRAAGPTRRWRAGSRRRRQTAEAPRLAPAPRRCCAACALLSRTSSRPVPLPSLLRALEHPFEHVEGLGLAPSGTPG